MKPNILMIMTDQHHAACLSHQGHPDVKTPNLDKLAASGVRFDNCFCSNGVCIPSRVSYMTGQYCHTHRVYGNDSDSIPADLLSLPSYLQNFGYQTAMIGKKHMPNWQSHGFQYERLCYTADAGTRALHYYNYLKQYNLHHLYDDLGDVEKFTLSDLLKVPVEHSLEVWTANETINYLDNQGHDKPFFMQTSFERPHPPLTVPEGCPFSYDPESITLPENSEELLLNETFFFDRNVELKWCKAVHGEKVLREALCAYYSLISLIDQQIGRIIDALEKNGLRDNTIIVFCADHGDFAGEYSKMAKGWNYDAIHRVPFIWNWPQKISSESIKNGLVETIDFFPTICSLLDIPIPKSVQGSDISHFLQSDLDSDHEAIFYEFIAVKTIRTPKYKLSYGFDGKKEIGELFDLTEDPHEYNNLFNDDSYCEIREKLLRKLLNWLFKTEQPVNFLPGNESLPETRWFQNH